MKKLNLQQQDFWAWLCSGGRTSLSDATSLAQRLLLFLAILVTGVNSAWADSGTISVKWFDSTNNSFSAAGTASVNNVLTVSDAVASSDLTVSSVVKPKNDENYWTDLQCATTSSTKNTISLSDFVSFTIAVKEGCTFTPTNVSCYIVGGGTGNNGGTIVEGTLGTVPESGLTLTNSGSSTSAQAITASEVSTTVTKNAGDTYTVTIYVGAYTDKPSIYVRDVTIEGTYTSPQTYTVTYNANGATSGSVPTDPNSPYVGNSTVTVLGNTGNLTKTGYDFGGWHLGSRESGIVQPGSNFTITADRTLYAAWTAKRYEIKYKHQGGVAFTNDEIAGLDTRHTYGTATVLKTPAKDGHTFVGWYTNAECTGDPITEIGAEQITATINLYAKWNIGSSTTGWNTAHSDWTTLNSGESYQFTFTNINESSTKNGYNTWCLLGYANKGDVDAIVGTRPFGCSWIGGDTDIKYEGDGATLDNYYALLHAGSPTTVTVSYHDGKIYVSAVNVDEENNRKYTLKYSSNGVSNAVNVRFTTDLNTIKDFRSQKLATPVTAISLNKAATTLVAGGATETLTATVTPAGATYKDVVWSTSDEAIATVTAAGVVTPIADGSANITATTLDGLYVATCAVTVGSQLSSECAVTNVKRGETALAYDEETKTYTLTIPYGDQGDRMGESTPKENAFGITFDVSVGASVTTSDQKTTPLSILKVFKSCAAPAGSTNQITLYVTAEDGRTQAEYTIKLVRDSKHVESITLDKTAIYIPWKGTDVISATVAPVDATNPNIIWTSSNGNATVSGGTVTGAAQYGGSAVVTATSAENSEISADCNVYVYRFGLAGSQTTVYTRGQSGVQSIVQANLPDEGYVASVEDFEFVSSNESVISIATKSYSTSNSRLLFTPTVGQAGTATITVNYVGSNQNYRGLTTNFTITVNEPITVAVPTIKINDQSVVGTETATPIATGQQITVGVEDGATLYYVWTSAAQSNYDSAENMIIAAGDYLKKTTTNPYLATTNTEGDRYLYAFAEKNGVYSNVVCARFNATKPNTVKIYEYGAQNNSEDIKYKYTTTGTNANGIKMDSEGYVYFDKGNTTEAGVLTLVFGARESGQLALGVYANTSNSATLDGSALQIGSTQASAKTGLTIESIEIPADKQYIYIKRTNNNQGVINKVIWTPGVTASTITATATNGTVVIKNEDYTVNSGTKIVAGTDLTFTATPRDEAYSLQEWRGAAEGTSNEVNKFDITVADANITVGAEFHTTLTASDLAVVGGKGTINVSYGADAMTLTKGTDYTTSSTGTITYTTSKDKVATVNENGTITFVGVGTATITLSQAKAGNYLEGSANFTVNVSAIDPTISTDPETITVGAGNKTNVTLKSNSDGAFTVNATSGVSATVTNNVLTITGGNTPGEATVTVHQAASGNYAAKDQVINVTVVAAVGEGTVLEVRGTKHSDPAPYYFTNSNSTIDIKLASNQEFSDGSQISPLSEDRTSSAFRGGLTNNQLTIKLNSSSASKIIVGAKGGGSTRNFSSIKVNGTEPASYTADKTFNFGSSKIQRFEISGLNILQGSEVTLTFSGSMNIYYFEVYSSSTISAPKITDNGDATGTLTSSTDGVTYKYKAYTERQTNLPAVSALTEETTSLTSVLASTSYVYAVAVKNGEYSDITEGVVNVSTIPSLSCRISEGNVVAKTIKVGGTATAVTTATMNKADATSQFTYVYESDNTSNATVDANTGVITGVSTGAAKITVKAKDDIGTVVAEDFVVVVVTDDDLVTPMFTWNGDPTLGVNGNQFDVNVNETFNEKKPTAYKQSGEGVDVRYADISAGYNITYYSSNGNAQVNSSAAVTGKKVGTATIIAVFAPKGDYEGSYNGGIADILANVKPVGTEALTVEVANNPNSIDLSSSALTYQSASPSSVKAGDVEVSSTNYRVVYESDNWNVATVDADGLVTAHNVGTATITIIYVPTNATLSGFKAAVKTYQIEVYDPTRFIVTKDWGSDSSVYPLYTIKDNNNYVTMTFGGWRGVNGTDDPTGNKGTAYGTGGGQDYWGGSSDGGKADAAGANPDYPYAITSKSGGNPTNEGINNYSPASATQFSVPCRGAYIMFEPSVDGTITANILQNGVIDADDYRTARTGRLVYIVDEFGHVVTPTAYGMASDVRNWKVGDQSTGKHKENGVDVPNGPLTKEVYLGALKHYGLVSQDATVIPTEGPYANGNVEEVIKFNEGYAVLAKGPTFYTFKVKAGKKYYVFGNGTKNGFYGFQFRKDEKFAPVTAEISTEVTNGNNSTAIVAGRSMNLTQAAALYDGKPVEIAQYDRTLKADIWQPIVLPYSMNDIQVKAIFGDGVDILYVDDVQGQTIKLSHHFYKTIVAGKSCLIKPSKQVTSLATRGITKDGVAYPYVTFSTAAITGYSDFTKVKQMTDFIWSAEYDPQVVKGGDYYVSTNNGNFTVLADGRNSILKGCRAFLKKTNPSAGAKALTVAMTSFEEDDTATGIEMAIFDEDSDEVILVNKTDRIYNLAGHEVNINSLKSGEVYIVNGKKFVAN